jgi:hypothetical protein
MLTVQYYYNMIESNWPVGVHFEVHDVDDDKRHFKNMTLSKSLFDILHLLGDNFITAVVLRRCSAAALLGGVELALTKARPILG